MALPGLRCADHIGITVPDLDEADRFLIDVLGGEFFYDLGPFEQPNSDWMTKRHFARHPWQLAMLAR